MLRVLCFVVVFLLMFGINFAVFKRHITPSVDNVYGGLLLAVKVRQF